jgi:hypothetical protein
MAATLGLRRRAFDKGCAEVGGLEVPVLAERHGLRLA